jgi:Ca2+-binding EF-hand superfamily protein
MLTFTDRLRLEEAFANADKNKDGYIDVNEMKSILSNNNVPSDDATIMAIFKNFDKNSDGKVDMEGK